MILLLILVVLALVFGVGAVVEGLLWALLVALLLIVAAGFFGWRTFRGVTGGRRLSDGL